MGGEGFEQANRREKVRQNPIFGSVEIQSNHIYLTKTFFSFFIPGKTISIIFNCYKYYYNSFLKDI